MRSFAVPFYLSVLLRSTNAAVNASTDAQFEAFCASDGHGDSNYCFQGSLSGTFIVRCRNGKAYLSDCSADLFCTNRVTDRNAFTNCYEHDHPGPNGDGRAQCAVGLGLPGEDVTVYADDGSTYTVSDFNEVSTPSPDYKGQGFYNDTYYALSGGSGYVGPSSFGSLCFTAPAPNVNRSGSGSSSKTSNFASATSTTAGVLGTGFASGGGELTTISAAGASSTETVAGTGYGSPTGSVATTGSGSGYHTPSTPTIVPFTGGASNEKVRWTMLAAMCGIVAMMGL